jgi:hypothetical protein
MDDWENDSWNTRLLISQAIHRARDASNCCLAQANNLRSQNREAGSNIASTMATVSQSTKQQPEVRN